MFNNSESRKKGGIFVNAIAEAEVTIKEVISDFELKDRKSTRLNSSH